MEASRTLRACPAVLVVGAALVASGCGGDGRSSEAGDFKIGGDGPVVEFGKNVARIPGKSAADVAGAAILAAYPPERAKSPKGWILTRRNRWRDMVLGAQFAADPVYGAVMPIEREYLPTPAIDLLARYRPEGFPKGDGLQVLILGEVGDDIFIDLQDQGLKLTQLKAKSPAKLSSELVPFRGGWAANFSANVMIVSSKARDYALPAAAWSAFSGDTIAFVDGERVPPETLDLLSQRQKLKLDKPNIYLAGPAGVIPNSVAEQLRRYGAVKRIPGNNPVELSVELARYKDARTGFGWGLSKGPANVSLVNTKDWGNAAGAFNFASAGPEAPLLLTNSSSKLPATLHNYLRSLKGGRANQGFVLGDDESVGSGVLRELDRVLAAKG